MYRKENKMCSEFGELDDVNDVTDVSSETTDIDEALDNMSLDELKDLRESLVDTQDTGENYEDVEQLEDLGAQEPDCSYHWDGGPTHNVEWDDDVEDSSVHSLKLTKHRQENMKMPEWEVKENQDVNECDGNQELKDISS